MEKEIRGDERRSRDGRRAEQMNGRIKEEMIEREGSRGEERRGQTVPACLLVVSTSYEREAAAIPRSN